MVFPSPHFLAGLVTLSQLACSFAVPMFNGTRLALHQVHSLSERASAPPPPHFAAYWDLWINGENGPPDPSHLKGFDTLILSFLLASGPADQVQEWVDIGSGERSRIISQYHSAGIKIMVSAFGATDAPTSAGYDPTSLAKKMASYVKSHNLDGIDVDYEDFDAIDQGTAVEWLITFTKTLRNKLPASKYIITHAPIAPWFSDSTGSPYVQVHNAVGGMIDWYNVQFYSQGNEYTSCNGLNFVSGGQYPKSSIFEISKVGVPLEKIVLGKPAIPAEASGYISASKLSTCVQQAKNAGWNAGVMVWQFPEAGASWIKTVRSKSWPV